MDQNRGALNTLPVVQTLKRSNRCYTSNLSKRWYEVAFTFTYNTSINERKSPTGTNVNTRKHKPKAVITLGKHHCIGRLSILLLKHLLGALVDQCSDHLHQQYILCM